MATYSYTAIKDNKVTVTGKIEARDISEARRKIRTMNLLPTSITDAESSELKKFDLLQKTYRGVATIVQLALYKSSKIWYNGVIRGILL